MEIQCENRKIFIQGLTWVNCFLGLKVITLCEVNQLELFLNKEAIWLYAELFLGHHDGSCHGLW